MPSLWHAALVCVRGISRINLVLVLAGAVRPYFEKDDGLLASELIFQFGSIDDELRVGRVGPLVPEVCLQHGNCDCNENSGQTQPQKAQPITNGLSLRLSCCPP